MPFLFPTLPCIYGLCSFDKYSSTPSHMLDTGLHLYSALWSTEWRQDTFLGDFLNQSIRKQDKNFCYYLHFLDDIRISLTPLTLPSLQLEASKEPLWSRFPWRCLQFFSSCLSWATLLSCSHLALMLLPFPKAVSILANRIHGPCITAFANFPPPGSQEGTEKHNRSPCKNLCPPHLGWELSLLLWVAVLSLTDLRCCSVMRVLALSPLT